MGTRLTAVATDGQWQLFDLEIDDTFSGYEYLVGELVAHAAEPPQVTVAVDGPRSVVAELLGAAGVRLLAELPAKRLGFAGSDRPGLTPLLRAHWITLRCRRVTYEALGGAREIESALHQLGAASRSLAVAVTTEFDDRQRFSKRRAIRWPYQMSTFTGRTQFAHRISNVRRDVKPALSDPGVTPPTSPIRSHTLDAQEIRFRLAAPESVTQPALIVDQPYEAVLEMLGPTRERGESGGRRDLPEPGQTDTVDSEWLLWSTGVELLPEAGKSDGNHPENPPAQAVITDGGTTQWLARFPLRLSRSGSPASQILRVIPRVEGSVRIGAIVKIAGDIHREFTIRLRVKGGVAGFAHLGAFDSPARPEPPFELEQRISTPEGECGKAPMVSWQRYGRRLNILITPPSIHYWCDAAGTNLEIFGVCETEIEPQIRRVREALGSLLKTYGSRFENIDARDLGLSLGRARLTSDWASDGSRGRHLGDRQEILGSGEFRQLAVAGNDLYRTVFPKNVRAAIEELKPGDLLHVTWHKEGGDPWIPDLPVALMYRRPPDPGVPIAPGGFLGLRLRLCFHPHSVAGPRLPVAAPSTRAHLLYWGGCDDDPAWLEAQRHRNELSIWQPVTLPAGQNRKHEMIRFLERPQPPGFDVLYFYCRALPRQPQNPWPGLVFGSENTPENVLLADEMGSGPLPEQPLVFANACETVITNQSPPHGLQHCFFQRGARAYIGTECLVPVAFAARFAETFFHFLHADSVAPITAGEAFAQARRFLWNEYGSIGGLFYTYINDYTMSVRNTATRSTASHRTRAPGSVA